MKKISAVLLVLVLVGSVVFAGFTGNANVTARYDLDTGEAGFKNGSNLKGTLTFGSALGEAKGEGDIYASITANLELTFGLGRDGIARMTDPKDVYDNLDIKYKASIKEAKIYGDEWSVSILGIVDIPSFAQSAIDMIEDDWWKTSTAAPVYMPFNMKSHLPRVGGVTGTYKNFTVGVGAYKPGTDLEDKDGDAIAEADLAFDFTVYGAVSALEVADGVALSVAAGYGSKTNYDDKDDVTTSKLLVAGAKADANFDNFAVMVSGDFNYNVANEKFGLEGQLAASTSVSDVDLALDVYAVHGPVIKNSDTEATTDKTKHISAKVTVGYDDLTVIATGKDLINKQNLGVKAIYKVNDQLKVEGRGGYRIVDPKWTGGASVEYALDFGVVEAGFDVFNASTDGPDADAVAVSANASVTSKTLVPGATLSLGWEAGDLTDVLTDPDSKLGAVIAKVAIAF
ncbi:MAG: hypothetical protein WCY53_06185 [Sphaerochaetaceae bacterium]